jgi:hypothetical protein
MLNSRNINEENSNSFSISSEIEKNFETLLDEFDSVDDLNEAKIDFTQVDKLEDNQEEKINFKISKGLTNFEKNNFNLNSSKFFNDLIENDNENGRIREHKEIGNRPPNCNLSLNASSSSEKYDEMIDIHPDKQDKIEANVKRFSAENGSLVTQASLNSLMKKNNMGIHNKEFIKSNSLECSCSKWTSPNHSHFHRLNSSNPMNHKTCPNNFERNKRKSDSSMFSHQKNIYSHVNNGERSFWHNDAISNLDLSSPNYLHRNNSVRLPFSANNSQDNSQEYNNYVKTSKNCLPLNLHSPMLNFDLDQSFGEAFSLNRTTNTNYGQKKESNNRNVNNNKNLNNNFKKIEFDIKRNELISGTSCNNINQINDNSGGSNYNNHNNPLFTYNKNNPKSSIPIYNKNSTNSSTFYFNMNNFLHYNDDKKLLDSINTLLQEQTGCRFVQLKIEEKNKKNDLQFLIKFFEKIKDNLITIIKDQFGNYVIQKFFEGIVLNSNLLIRFFQVIRKDLFQISTNLFGTRFFQKSLEILTSLYKQIENDVINEILKELVVNNCYDLIIDTNGNHVFQKILILYPREKNQFIYDELNKISLEVARIKQGGCIFQRAFDIASFNQKKFLISEILKNVPLLINDEYGNFIIQSIIYLKLPEVNDSIFNFLKDKLLDLSKKKFSSNVIDKVILN